MTSLFPKKYSHDFEQQLSKQREKEWIFTPPPTPREGQESFVIGLPPPNVTGVLHAGHSLMITVEDVMVRYQRMLGKHTLRIPGTDHAGIATQIKVEQHLLEKTGKTKEHIWREAFINKTRDRSKKHRSTIVGQIKHMGASCDRSREQFTLSEQLSRAVRKSFTNLYREGKIYQWSYITNRCPATQTVVSDVEINYKETTWKMYHIRYFMDSKSDTITIATSRPETIFADVAIAVNPQDKRYKKLIGKTVLIPIINRRIPIIGDQYVDMQLGTGALKITPAHDQHDFEIAKRHNLATDIYAFDKKGDFTEHAGKDFAGKPVEQFFDNIIDFLNDIGNLVKTEQYPTKIPYSDRGNAKIQPMLSTQRFVDMKHYASEVSLAVRRDEVQITPERYKETFYQRLDNIQPRCISRQLWWGHRIPIRYGQSGKAYALDEDSIINAHTWSSHLVLSLIIFNLIADLRINIEFWIDELIDVLTSNSITPQHGYVIDAYIDTYRIAFFDNTILSQQVEQISNIFTQIQEDPEHITNLIDLLEQSFAIKHTSNSYIYQLDLITWEEIVKQDEDVFDTWFSSALWPFSILGRPDQTPDMKHFYPNTVLETGYDIIFFRVARMMMMWLANTGKLPFHHVYLNGLVRDPKGRKFSKSLGNGINPLDIIKEYWTDAFRLALIVNSTPGNDIVFSIDKVKLYSRCINKLWNATRYVMTKIWEDTSTTNKRSDMIYLSTYITDHISESNDFDLRILQKINILIDDVTTKLDKYQYGEAWDHIIQLLRHDFCDWYIEISKKHTSELTHTVMHYVIGTLLTLLHPYTPFITEQLRKQCGFEGWLALQPRPKQIPLPEKNYKINVLMESISIMRHLRTTVWSKPHEQVEIFLQSGSEFHIFVQQYTSLITYLTKASSIQYFLHGETAPEWFSTSIIADIVIGIKWVVIIDKKMKIIEFERKLSEEQQYLQNIRSSLSNPWFLSQAPASLIESKKQKAEEIKKNITLIELELHKLKS